MSKNLLDYRDQSECWLTLFSVTLQNDPLNLQHVCRQWRAEAKSLRASWNSMQRELQKSRALKHYFLRKDMAMVYHALSVVVPALRYADAALQRIQDGDAVRARTYTQRLGKHLLGKIACELNFCGQRLSSTSLEQRKVALRCLQNAPNWPSLPDWVVGLQNG